MEFIVVLVLRYRRALRVGQASCLPLPSSTYPASKDATSTVGQLETSRAPAHKWLASSSLHLEVADPRQAVPIWACRRDGNEWPPDAT